MLVEKTISVNDVDVDIEIDVNIEDVIKSDNLSLSEVKRLLINKVRDKIYISDLLSDQEMKKLLIELVSGRARRNFESDKETVKECINEMIDQVFI